MIICHNYSCLHWNENKNGHCSYWVFNSIEQLKNFTEYYNETGCIENCYKYTDKPKISAWELFRELQELDQFYIEVLKILPDEFSNEYLGDWENTLTWLLSLNEQEAIEILQKIKGELE